MKHPANTGVLVDDDRPRATSLLMYNPGPHPTKVFLCLNIPTQRTSHVQHETSTPPWKGQSARFPVPKEKSLWHILIKDECPATQNTSVPFHSRAKKIRPIFFLLEARARKNLPRVGY